MTPAGYGSLTHQFILGEIGGGPQRQVDWSRFPELVSRYRTAVEGSREERTDLGVKMGRLAPWMECTWDYSVGDEHGDVHHFKPGAFARANHWAVRRDPWAWKPDDPADADLARQWGWNPDKPGNPASREDQKDRESLDEAWGRVAPWMRCIRTFDLQGRRHGPPDPATTIREDARLRADDEIVRRFPDNFRPFDPAKWDLARKFGWNPSAKRSSSSRPAPRDGRSPVSNGVAFNRERSAKHEAGHAAAAVILGWKVTGLHVGPDGGSGSCQVEQPPGLADRQRAEQSALISLSGAAAEGWTAWPGDAGDRRDATEVLLRHFGDERNVAVALARYEAQARSMASTPRFRALRRIFVEELLSQDGWLSSVDVAHCCSRRS